MMSNGTRMFGLCTGLFLWCDAGAAYDSSDDELHTRSPLTTTTTNGLAPLPHPHHRGRNVGTENPNDLDAETDHHDKEHITRRKKPEENGLVELTRDHSSWSHADLDSVASSVCSSVAPRESLLRDYLLASQPMRLLARLSSSSNSSSSSVSGDSFRDKLLADYKVASTRSMRARSGQLSSSADPHRNKQTSDAHQPLGLPASNHQTRLSKKNISCEEQGRSGMEA